MNKTFLFVFFAVQYCASLGGNDALRTFLHEQYDQWSPNTRSYMMLLMIDMDQYGMDFTFTILSRDAQQSMDIVTNTHWLVQQYQYITLLALTMQYTVL